MRQTFTFDDVLIQPSYSDIDSRVDISLAQDFFDLKESVPYGRDRYLRLDVPIISANMDYVTGGLMANAMYRNGGFGIIHRFADVGILGDEYAYANKMAGFYWGFSVGTKNIISVEDTIKYAMKFVPTVVCIDIAHGHHKKVVDVISLIRDKWPRLKIIAGNVATNEGFYDLARAGAHAVKVGIGPGAVCTTREVAGVGVPQLSAIMDCVAAKEFFPDVKLIADGGIKNSGDIVKALAAGADAVMLGSLLAGTSEAPGELRVAPDNSRWKPYRGQSIFGANGDKYVPEGVEGYVKEKGPVAEVIRKLAAGIRSGMSYVGARNLEELRDKSEFIQVSHGTVLESETRINTDDRLIRA